LIFFEPGRSQSLYHYACYTIRSPYDGLGAEIKKQNMEAPFTNRTDEAAHRGLKPTAICRCLAVVSGSLLLSYFVACAGSLHRASIL
jgi:hypothetical protein